MSGETARVQYFDKQFLRVDEFRDEQLYQLALRRRHNNTQHTWGIARGLAIAEVEGSIVVQPGLAIDGYGRELLLATKQRIAEETFDDLASDRLDVWLIYDRQNGEAAPEGYGECGASDTKSYRSTETPLLLVERPRMNKVDPRKPPGVSTDALNAPVPPVSDDPQDAWRVYLGRIIRLQDGKVSIDLSRRPYVGVVAETIDHPGNAARVEVGRDSQSEATRTIGGVTYVYKNNANAVRHFGVFVPEDLAANAVESAVELSPRLEVLEDGTIGWRGATNIYGNLGLFGGALQFPTGVTFTEDTVPQEPSMYRYTEAGQDELRIDLGANDNGARKFVIGFSKPDGKFTPCVTVELKVDSSNELVPLVTIAGDLKIEGKWIGEVLPVMVSPEALAAIRGSFQAGLAAGNIPA